MAQPNRYEPQAGFAEQTRNNVPGRSPINARALDDELSGISQSINGIVGNLELIQRDDGSLKDATVHLHALGESVLNLIGGFNLRGEWQANISYAAKDIVDYQGHLFVCMTANQDAAFTAANWHRFGEKGAELHQVLRQVAHMQTQVQEEGRKALQAAAQTQQAAAQVAQQAGTVSTSAQQAAASAREAKVSADAAEQARVRAEAAAANAEGAVNNVNGKLGTKLDTSVFNEFKGKAATKEELEQMRGTVLSASQIRGKIELLPFPADALPQGWYHANGDQYEDTTPQGRALSALPTALKQAFRIVLTGTKINLPNFYHTDGRGYFLRASKTLGTVQDDAIRNIVGNLYFVISGAGNLQPTGAFGYQTTNGLGVSGQGFKGGHQSNTYAFNAANVVPTANENRPLNIGLTPAIYLGV